MLNLKALLEGILKMSNHFYYLSVQVLSSAQWFPEYLSRFLIFRFSVPGLLLVEVKRPQNSLFFRFYHHEQLHTGEPQCAWGSFIRLPPVPGSLVPGAKCHSSVRHMMDFPRKRKARQPYTGCLAYNHTSWSEDGERILHTKSQLA